MSAILRELEHFHIEPLNEVIILSSMFSSFFVALIFFSIFQFNKMNPERRPLLMDAEMQGRSARPDLRSSPQSTLVDVKSEDDGKQFPD